MKKILSLILCGILLFGITGCGNNESVKDNSNENSNNNAQENNDTEKENNKKENNLTLSCSGDYLFTFGFIVGKRQVSGGNEEISSYAFDDTEDIGKGEYLFTFDNDKLIKITSTEIISSEYSQQISDAQLNSLDGQIDGCEISRNSDKKLVMECNYSEDSDIVKALNLDAETPTKLKIVLEENTDLICK